MSDKATIKKIWKILKVLNGTCTVNPYSVYHGVLSKRPRSGIVVKVQGASRSCPGKLRNFLANNP